MLGRLLAHGRTTAGGRAAASRHRRRGPILVAAITLAGCGGAARGTVQRVSTTSSAPTGHARVEQAVALASQGHSYRVRGELDASVGPIVSWAGIVVGIDEQAVATSGGITYESRRVGGVLWTRRLDPRGPWIQLPLDQPLDLTALSRGSEVSTELRDGRWVVEVAYEGVDVLRALTHIPSAGLSTAEITLEDRELAAVVVRLGNGAAARLAYSDFGADLTVEPVNETDATNGPGDHPGRGALP